METTASDGAALRSHSWQCPFFHPLRRVCSTDVFVMQCIAMIQEVAPQCTTISTAGARRRIPAAPCGGFRPRATSCAHALARLVQDSIAAFTTSGTISHAQTVCLHKNGGLLCMAVWLNSKLQVPLESPLAIIALQRLLAAPATATAVRVVHKPSSASLVSPLSSHVRNP